MRLKLLWFVAGMLALYIAFSLNLAYPIWAIGTVFVIANPYSGMTSSKSLYRVLGTLLGAIVSIAVTPLLINTPWLFTFFLAAWVGFCLYISLLDRTPRSYVSMLAGYTTVIICYNIIYYADTVSIFDMAIGRFLEQTDEYFKFMMLFDMRKLHSQIEQEHSTTLLLLKEN